MGNEEEVQGLSWFTKDLSGLPRLRTWFLCSWSQGKGEGSDFCHTSFTARQPLLKSRTSSPMKNVLSRAGGSLCYESFEEESLKLCIAMVINCL